MEQLFSFDTDNCRMCVCHACKDKGTRFCKNHCDNCKKRSGDLRRKRCIYTPVED